MGSSLSDVHLVPSLYASQGFVHKEKYRPIIGKKITDSPVIVKAVHNCVLAWHGTATSEYVCHLRDDTALC